MQDEEELLVRHEVVKLANSFDREPEATFTVHAGALVELDLNLSAEKTLSICADQGNKEIGRAHV